MSQSVCPWQTFQASSSVKGQTLQLITETVNYGRNIFYDKGPWGQCYKTIFLRNLQIFVISWSGCPWQAFPAQFIVSGQGQEHILQWST